MWGLIKPTRAVFLKDTNLSFHLSNDSVVLLLAERRASNSHSKTGLNYFFLHLVSPIEEDFPKKQSRHGRALLQQLVAFYYEQEVERDG